MQDLTSDICNQVETPSPSATTSTSTIYDYQTLEDKTEGVPELHLLDKRDNQEYTIRKLADGNCWMTENLRIGSSDHEITLTSELSDLTEGRTFTLPMAIDAAGTQITRESPFIFERTDETYGNLYNYYTVTAGAIDGDGNSLIGVSVGDAVGSICAKNWKLPSHDDWLAVIVDHGITSADPLAFPVDLVLAGYYMSTTLFSVNEHGHYISSTIADVNRVYNLYINVARISKDNDNGISIAGSVRCVLK